MSNIDQTIKEIRPRLRHAAPQTFWFSLGFAIFNILIAIAILNYKVFITLHVVGIVPLPVWAIVFGTHGICMLAALYLNDYKAAKLLNVFGMIIKTAWWFELVSITIIGRSPFMLYVWSLILFLQVINFIYFVPKAERD